MHYVFKIFHLIIKLEVYKFIDLFYKLIQIFSEYQNAQAVFKKVDRHGKGYLYLLNGRKKNFNPKLKKCFLYVVHADVKAGDEF